MQPDRLANGPPLRMLKRLLHAVCVADVLLGSFILFTPALLFRLFNVPLPEDLLWFQLIGLMLIPSAAHAFMGFRNAERCRMHALISGVGRLATAGFLFTVGSVRNVPPILVALAIGEGLVGALTAYYLLRLGHLLSPVGAREQKTPGVA